MAITLMQLENRIRIKYLIKPQKYFLFWGSRQCQIDGKWQNGYKTLDEAIENGNNLFGVGYLKKSIQQKQNNMETVKKTAPQKVEQKKQITSCVTLSPDPPSTVFIDNDATSCELWADTRSIDVQLREIDTTGQIHAYRIEYLGVVKIKTEIVKP